jgi:hypothetical protein
VVNGRTIEADEKPLFNRGEDPNLEFKKFENLGITGRALVSYDEASKTTSVWMDVTESNSSYVARGGGTNLEVAPAMVSLGQGAIQFRIDCGDASLVKAAK